MTAPKAYGCRAPLTGGPTPPAYMLDHNSLAYAVLARWQQQHDPHLYHHEQVRLAEAAVTRSRSRYAPGYAIMLARQRLQRATAEYREYHRVHGLDHDA